MLVASSVGVPHSGSGANRIGREIPIPTVFDSIGGYNQQPASSDTAANDAAVYAVFTPVPEPGTALLMGLGLLALGSRNRRNV